MFGLIKKAFGLDNAPRPEVELRETFAKLLGTSEHSLKALHISLVRFYEVLGMDDRLINLISSSEAELAKQKAEHFAYLEKIFQMEKTFAEKGMNAESTAAKLIALWFGCYLVGGSLKETFAQQDARRIFEHFKKTTIIDLNPPRRAHISPS